MASDATERKLVVTVFVLHEQPPEESPHRRRAKTASSRHDSALANPKSLCATPAPKCPLEQEVIPVFGRCCPREVWRHPSGRYSS